MTTERLSDPIDTAPDERANRTAQMTDKEFQKLMNEKILGTLRLPRSTASVLSVMPRGPK